MRIPEVHLSSIKENFFDSVNIGIYDGIYMFPEQFRENILYGIIKIVGNHDLSGKMIHDKCPVIYNDGDMCIQASCDLLCRDQRSGRGVGKSIPCAVRVLIV